MKEENSRENDQSHLDIPEYILEEMIYHLYSNGVVLKNKDNSGVINCPVSIFPSPVISSLFKKIEFYQLAFNKVIDRMSRDVGFLKITLSPLAESDVFIKKHLQLLEASEANKNKQSLQLGIFRNDFMIDSIKKFIYQIEINTIASSMGFFSDALREFHQFFTKKYPDLFKKYHNCEFIDNENITHYKVPLDRPEVVPSIAESIDQALAIYVNNLNNSNNLLNAINSDLTTKFFSKKNVIVLFVVQENERNIFDQRAIERKLYNTYNINVVRMTLQEIHNKAKIDSNGEMTIDDKIIGVVYFRSAYDIKDFPNDDAWKAREMIELSNAIKCPNINTFLCTFKIFQYELSKKEVLAKYIPEELIANDISRFFTKIYFLEKMSKEERIETLKQLASSPQNYVVKPQKEGGGNNYYDKDILALLPNDIESDEINPILKDSIIMEKINPPSFENLSIREGKLIRTQSISEFSIYGIILSNSENVYLINKNAGYLVRTKSIDINEGGVAAGYSAIDLPYLIDNDLY